MVKYCSVGARPNPHRSDMGEGHGDVIVEKVIGEGLIVVVNLMSLRYLFSRVLLHLRHLC